MKFEAPLRKKRRIYIGGIRKLLSGTCRGHHTRVSVNAKLMISVQHQSAFALSRKEEEEEDKTHLRYFLERERADAAASKILTLDQQSSVIQRELRRQGQRH